MCQTGTKLNVVQPLQTIDAIESQLFNSHTCRVSVGVWTIERSRHMYSGNNTTNSSIANYNQLAALLSLALMY